MRNPVDLNAHVTQAALDDLVNGLLAHDELATAAQHIARCEPCALALAEAIEARPAAIAVPDGFDEEVLKRISSPKGKRTELTCFSLRVALAAGIALFFVFSSAWGTLGGLQEPLSNIKAPDFSAVERINMRLQDFSQQILDMEVFQYAQETK